MTQQIIWTQNLVDFFYLSGLSRFPGRQERIEALSERKLKKTLNGQILALNFGMYVIPEGKGRYRWNLTKLVGPFFKLKILTHQIKSHWTALFDPAWHFWRTVLCTVMTLYKSFLVARIPKRPSDSFKSILYEVLPSWHEWNSHISHAVVAPLMWRHHLGIRASLSLAAISFVLQFLRLSSFATPGTFSFAMYLSSPKDVATPLSSVAATATWAPPFSRLIYIPPT